MPPPGTEGSLSANKDLFIGTDSSAPQNVTVSINNGESSTTSTKVTLNLSANDNSGVSAYYASESNSAPASSADGWQTLKPRFIYYGVKPFTIGSESEYGTFTKTVYVWFKDAKGNVSNSASDSIQYIFQKVVDPNTDNTAPVVSITTPIPSETNDKTPSFVITSSEAGTITFNGSCSSSSSSVKQGSNTITLNTLPDGTYSNCSFSVSDSSGNSKSLNISTFKVDSSGLVILKEYGDSSLAAFLKWEYYKLTTSNKNSKYFKFKQQNQSYKIGFSSSGEAIFDGFKGVGIHHVNNGTCALRMALQDAFNVTGYSGEINIIVRSNYDHSNKLISRLLEKQKVHQTINRNIDFRGVQHLRLQLLQEIPTTELLHSRTLRIILSSIPKF